MKAITRKSMLYRELINNTENIYMIAYLEDARDNILEERVGVVDAADWEDVINCILDDGYDMSGFGLWEIPTDGVYIFYNRVENAGFFIETKLYDPSNTKPIPSYYKTTEDGTFHYAASSIDEAVVRNDP